MIVTLYVLIFILFFLLIVQKESIKNNGILIGINSTLNFLLLLIIIGNATFNNDWQAYEILFEGIKVTNDLFYFFGFELFRSMGLAFVDFYLCNQILIYILILFFIFQFSSKYLFLVVFTILIVACPNFSILLRYYTAFTFFLVSAYHFKISQNRILAYFFLFCSFISHFGALILLGIFAIFKYFKIQTSIKSVLIIGLGLLLIKEILFGLLISFGIGSFSIYVTEEETSSLRGGVLVVLPYLPWMFFVYWQHRRLLNKNKDIQSDRKYVFLYQLSILPFFLIFLSIFNQIVQHRYVEPFSIVWCTYLCYSLRYDENKLKRFLGGLWIFILILISFYLKYFLPLTLIGRSEWLFYYLQILNSNSFEIFKISDFN